MVGELGVMANGLQCNVFIILPPGVQRVIEGRERDRKRERMENLWIEQSSLSIPQEVVSSTSTSNSSHFLFSNILKLSHTLLHQLCLSPFTLCSSQSLLMIINETALLGDLHLKTQALALLESLHRKGVEKRFPEDLVHLSLPLLGHYRLTLCLLPLAYVAELVSCLTREFVKRLPRNMVVDLFFFF